MNLELMNSRTDEDRGNSNRYKDTVIFVFGVLHYILPFFLMQQISDWRELIGLRSSPGRGEWLGEA